MEDIVVGHLKELCDMGVEIYSCGTCLKFYELEQELKVGRIGSIDQVIDGMRDFTGNGMDLGPLPLGREKKHTAQQRQSIC